MSQGLGGVRHAARARKQERLTALLQPLTIDLLREGYFALKRRAAAAVDGEVGNSMNQAWRSGLSTSKRAKASPCR